MFPTLSYAYSFQIFFIGLVVVSAIILILVSINQKKKPVEWKTQAGYRRFRLIWTAIPLLAYSLLIVLLAPYIFVPVGVSTRNLYGMFYVLAGLIFTIFAIPLFITWKKYGKKVAMSNKMEP